MTSRAPSSKPKTDFYPYRPKIKKSNQVWLIWTPFANLPLSNDNYVDDDDYDEDDDDENYDYYEDDKSTGMAYRTVLTNPRSYFMSDKLLIYILVYITN